MPIHTQYTYACIKILTLPESNHDIHFTENFDVKKPIAFSLQKRLNSKDILHSTFILELWFALFSAEM